MFHETTKHIDVRYRFVCEILAHGDIVQTWLLSFDLWGFVMEEEYSLDLVLRYEVC